jgi:hypothetical protein
MGGRGRYLYEWKDRIDERTGVLDGGELSEAEAFGDTFETEPPSQIKLHTQEWIQMVKCLLIFLV